MDNAARSFATWTGPANVPVLINGAEPPRMGWAQILGFAVGADAPPSLVEHRAFMFRTHLPWPIVLRAATRP